jgi:FkbH-like protein
MDSINFSNSNFNGARSSLADLKRSFLDRDEFFWGKLARESFLARSFGELAALSGLRKRALKAGFTNFDHEGEVLRIALIGGSTLYPLSEMIEHLISISGSGKIELFVGDYNNYRAEILEPASRLYEFQPQFVVILPDEKNCRYAGRLTDSPQAAAREAERVSRELLWLCGVLRERSAAEILLCSFIPSPYHDLGALRSKLPTSDWNFKRSVNLALGAGAPNYLHICDSEFLAYRLGAVAAKDEKSWFESKQLCSPAMQTELAREIVHLITTLKQQPKKVLALDLDNTLWGGVVADDGLEGIEIGDTTPRGEAFKAFQSYVLSLCDRGVLLAACSKNDFDAAIEPFRRHPEMVLREEHFVSFKANWQPKAQNLIEMAEELNLGLDSFVFVDDNPAEIENVRQFAPAVTTVLLDPDASQFVRQLQESRLFERFSITNEDSARTAQYRKEAERKSAAANFVDMNAYLESLEMVGIFTDFNPLDLPRAAQLINKSNQFNLTTRRRTEPELENLLLDPDYFGFTMRLADRFGDHGLISVIICHLAGAGVLEIDTWLMSCRVLKRGVEEEVLNEIVRRAGQAGCRRIRGVYLPTEKNKMVADLYPGFGFRTIAAGERRSEFELDVEEFSSRPTFIEIKPRLEQYEHHEGRSIAEAAVNF